MRADLPDPREAAVARRRLDDLQERLARLPESHPSACEGAVPGGGGPAGATADRAAPGTSGGPDETMLDRDAPEGQPDRDVPDRDVPEAGGPEGGRPEAGQRGAGWRGAGRPGDSGGAGPERPPAAAPGQAGSVRAALGRYRPWFTAGDVPQPWFSSGAGGRSG